jgi:putative ATP-dependent endonuclease of OLD family
VRLTRVRIEGYRAIRSLVLELEPDRTALFGENGFGKTSLIDALLSVLGPGGALTYRAADFHTPAAPRPPSPRIVLELAFAETRDDERLRRRGLAPAIVGPPGDGQVWLRVEAERPATDGGGDELVAGAPTFLDPRGEPLQPQPPPATLAALRQACPVVVLRAGRWILGPVGAPGGGQRPTGRLPAAASAGLSTGAGAELGDQALERRVLEAFVNVGREGDEPTPALAAGIEAAQALVREHAAGAGHPPLLEALAAASDPHIPGLPAGDPGGGAHGLAALLIVGALFQARSAGRLDDDAEPFLVVENTEAHLHPIVAANASRLIDGLQLQRLVTTNSAELVKGTPLACLRRAVREADGDVVIHRVARRALSQDEWRRVAYHVRGTRADALFARGWLLAEGETEFWLLPDLAKILGFDLPSEGVRVVEFAQCGVDPIVKLARALGIGWHLLSDGDEAGQRYAERARELAGDEAAERVTCLPCRDIERCLWDHGLDLPYRRAAGLPDRPKAGRRGPDPQKVITQAIDRTSKPRLALDVLDEAAARGPSAVPPSLRSAIESAVRLARRSACGWETAATDRVR